MLIPHRSPITRHLKQLVTMAIFRWRRLEGEEDESEVVYERGVTDSRRQRRTARLSRLMGIVLSSIGIGAALATVFATAYFMLNEQGTTGGTSDLGKTMSPEDTTPTPLTENSEEMSSTLARYSIRPSSFPVDPVFNLYNQLTDEGAKLLRGWSFICRPTSWAMACSSVSLGVCVIRSETAGEDAPDEMSCRSIPFELNNLFVIDGELESLCSRRPIYVTKQ